MIIERSCLFIAFNAKAARVIERKTNYHKYELYAHTPVIVRENTLYYPGWNLIVDNKPSLFEILKEHPKGVIQFELEKGPHIIELKLTDQGIMFYSKLISIGAFLGALFIVLGIYFKKLLLLMKD